MHATPSVLSATSHTTTAKSARPLDPLKLSSSQTLPLVSQFVLTATMRTSQTTLVILVMRSVQSVQRMPLFVKCASQLWDQLRLSCSMPTVLASLFVLMVSLRVTPTTNVMLAIQSVLFAT